MNNSYVITLLQSLIKVPSVTPDIKCVQFLSDILEKMNFKCDVQIFEDTGNLYASIGNENGKRNLCFSGHTDVVPLIDISQWTVDPFGDTIQDNKIYGRGTVDMKGGIAAFISAYASISEEIKNSYLQNHQLSFLITGDEEGTGKNGTKKMLEYINAKNIKITDCIIGEPTAYINSLDSVHIGRRGSMNFVISINGKEGHVAYPENIDNPITKINQIGYFLKELNFNQGDEKWNPTNLEITGIDAHNMTRNIILKEGKIYGNIRFNKYDKIEKLLYEIELVCKKVCKNHEYNISYSSTHQGYESNEMDLANLCLLATKEINPTCTFTTRGGVTDGSFLSHYCKNICELGPKEMMAHKINEYIEIEDLLNLEKAYCKILNNFFTNA